MIGVARLVNLTFFLLTSLYCLLASSPFANEQFIKPNVSGWLTTFVVFHADCYWLTLSITALTLARFLNGQRTRVALGWTYLAAGAAIGAWLSMHRVLPDPQEPHHALLVAVLALLPPLGLAWFDHVALPCPAVEPIREDRRLLVTCLGAGVFCWLTFAVSVPFRLASAGLQITSRELSLGMAAAAVAQTAGFMLIFATLSVAGGLGARWRWPPRAELAALAVLAACGAAIIVAKVVLAPIAIVGQAAWFVSAAIGSTLAAVWSGVALHLSAPAQPPGTSVVDVWCAPLVPRPPRLRAFFLVILPLAAFLMVNRVSMFDWDFMVQKLIAIAVSVAAFALVHSLTRRRARETARREPAPAFMVPALAAVLCATATIGAARLLPAVEQRPVAALDTYLAADPSLRLARDLTAGRDESSAAFYSYLRANSGIKGDVRPIDISFFKSSSAVGRSARPPHIFLFVIDSLRRDYVSPYNPEVTFTPSIAAFARESVTFNRAFSRYGGTGLSVPAIWAGGMIIHKEYVKPFAPMNALAKLLDAHGYRRFITADHITDELFPRSTETVDLDRGVSEMGHTFCGTVGELQKQIVRTGKTVKIANPAGAGAGTDDVAPPSIFAHTRPLDLHIGNVWSARAPQGEAYPGFHATYASRVHRIDACFGEFVDFLRREHLYDDSVIVLTADHGDSLGEGLRWGHGFTVFPEVLRIPLIVHLPPALAAAFEADVERVSFTVDITPTLYALLGNAPIAREPEYGSPLFARSRADLTDRQHAAFLVASSYGSVYGLLSDNGTHLYIADAINGREYAFDLSRQAPATGSGGDVRIGLTDAQRAAARQAISEQVAALAAEYHYAPGVSPAGQ